MTENQTSSLKLSAPLRRRPWASLSKVTPESRTGERPFGAWDVLLTSAWFGLAVGLAELAITLALKPLFDPAPGLFRMNRLIVWAIPAVNLGLFGICGTLLALASWIRPSSSPRLLLFPLISLTVVTVLLAFRSLDTIACIVVALALGFRLAQRIAARLPGFRRLCRVTGPVLAAGFGLIMAVSLGGPVVRAAMTKSRVPFVMATGSRPPNVLLVVLDTVRADRMSLYGYNRDTTPNLARLASRGVCFTQARSAAPWTLPSHASMLTGRWVHEHKAGMDRPLDGTYPTLAEYLSAHGYATGGFVSNATYCGGETGCERGFTHFDDRDHSILGSLWITALGRRVICPLLMPQEDRVGGNPLEYVRKDAARIKTDMLEWLDRQGDRPFFAFLNIYDAHDPYIPPADFRRRFGSPPKSPREREILDRWFITDKAKLTADESRFVADAYDDCLAYVDEQVGQLFQELESRDKLANTLVIITADHGEHFGEHGLYGHGSSLYDQEIRVPLLILPATGTATNQKVTAPVSLRDLPATVAEVLRPGTASGFPGRSLAHHWSAQPLSDLPPLLAEVDEPAHASPNQGRSPVFRGAMKAVTRGNHVYIRNGDGREELYDVGADPSQTRDLAPLAESKTIIDGFRADLEQLLR